MTDRYDSFTVVLKHNIRSDDAKATINAIKQIKGVLSVTPNINDSAEHVAEMRVRNELTEALWKVLHP